VDVAPLAGRVLPTGEVALGYELKSLQFAAPVAIGVRPPSGCHFSFTPPLVGVEIIGQRGWSSLQFWF
jgi:hypothetical protein